MGKRGLLIVAAVAATIAVVLVGRSVVNGDYQAFVNQAASDVRWNNDLGKIADDIRAVHGVTDVSTAFNALALPEAKATVSVRLSTGAREANLQQILAVVRSGALVNDFPPNLLTLSLRMPDGSAFDQSSFRGSATTGTLTVQSWDSLRTTTGLPLAISLAPSPEGYLDSIVSVVLRPVHSSPAALAKLVAAYPVALANTSGATSETRWMMPGFSSSGALPSTAALTLLGSIARIAPLSGDVTAIKPASGANLNWNSKDQRYSTIGAFYPSPGKSATRNSDRERADRIAAVVAVSPVIVQNFFYEAIIGNKVIEYRFYTGDCDAPEQSSAQNATWVTHLASIGVVLPRGSGAGMCVPKHS